MTPESTAPCADQHPSPALPHGEWPGARTNPREDWSQLIGHTIEVWNDGQRVAAGTVENATKDNTVLWIAASGAQARKLYDKLAGYSVFLLEA